MTPTTQRNLLIYQGADWEETFYLVSRSGRIVTTTRLLTGESAIDVTDYELIGDCRAGEDADEDVAFEFVFTKDEVNNRFTASVSGAITSALTVGETADSRASKFWYDFLATDADDVTTRVQEGMATIKRAITRDPSQGMEIDGGSASSEFD